MTWATIAILQTNIQNRETDVTDCVQYSPEKPNMREYAAKKNQTKEGHPTLLPPVSACAKKRTQLTPSHSECFSIYHPCAKDLYLSALSAGWLKVKIPPFWGLQLPINYTILRLTWAYLTQRHQNQISILVRCHAQPKRLAEVRPFANEYTVV